MRIYECFHSPSGDGSFADSPISLLCRRGNMNIHYTLLHDAQIHEAQAIMCHMLVKASANIFPRFPLCSPLFPHFPPFPPFPPIFPRAPCSVHPPQP